MMVGNILPLLRIFDYIYLFSSSNKPWTDEKNNSAYCHRRRWIRTKLYLSDIFTIESTPAEIEKVRETHTEKRKLREKNIKSKRESEEKVHIDTNNNQVSVSKAKNVGF